MDIDARLVKYLVAEQFPQWRRLAVRPVARSGWDHRSFRLGPKLLARLPSAAAYVVQVEREQRWLPFLRQHLSFAIPELLAQGQPGCGYAWPWSVYGWISGKAVADQAPSNGARFAIDLADCLAQLQAAPADAGPKPGPENFHRGAPLLVYDAQLREALAVLHGKVDSALMQGTWDRAAATVWERPAVWVHGDIAPGNLLLCRGRLAALIDFGQLSVGDPACDLAIAWTTLRPPHREAFRRHLALDENTWQRGRAWALWKAAIVAAGLAGADAAGRAASWQTLREVHNDAAHDVACRLTACAGRLRQCLTLKMH